jgi:hypothetical protein
VSALIFVAVAVAWLVYLVPKALEHHDESLRSRTVSTFSHTMRVLARREPDSSRTTKLVAGATGAAAPEAPRVVADAPRTSPSGPTKKIRSATARRRNVLIVLLLANAAVAGVAGYGLIGWVWQAAPAALLVAWLIACRLMVRSERKARRTMPVRPVAITTVPVVAGDLAGPAAQVSEASGEIVLGDVLDTEFVEAGTQSIPVVSAESAESWDPVNVPLPTYVSKPPAARRTVRTIDLDSTGVWSSGRSESDSALVAEAEADAARREAHERAEAERRAAGS